MRGRAVPTRLRRSAVRALVAVLAFGLPALVSCGAGDDGFGLVEVPEGEADYRYVIPAGTGAAIDRGDEVDLLPAELKVTVGEVIELVNDDDRGHLVGPFFIGAQETIRYRFSSPGVLEGECGVHSDGRFAVTVVP